MIIYSVYWLLFFNLNFINIKIMLDDTILETGMDILEGRFKVLKKLGSGAFGEIYKGMYSSPSLKMLIFVVLLYSWKEKVWRSFRCKNCKWFRPMMMINKNITEKYFETYRKKPLKNKNTLCCSGKANWFIKCEEKVSPIAHM